MWKSRNVWILMSGQLVAGLGLWFGIIGNLEFLQHTVSSQFLTAAILMIGLLMGVFLAPYAGSVIDRGSKKKVLMTASAARIIAVGFMFVAIRLDSVWWMIGFSVVNGIAVTFYFPALQALIPRVVKAEQLIDANAMFMNMMTLSRIAGTALAGILLIRVSLTSLYLFMLLAYVLLFITTVLLREDEMIEPSNKLIGKKEKASFREVLPILRRLPLVGMTFVLSFIPTFFIGGFNLMVIAISDLQSDPAIKGLLYTCEGICLMIGGFITKRLTNRIKPAPLMLGSVTVIALFQASLFLAKQKWAPLVSFGGFGLGAGCFFALSTSIFQTEIPKELHGRFFSFNTMAGNVLFQIILLSTGLFLDTIGLQKMSLVYASCSALIIIYYLWKRMSNRGTTVDPSNSDIAL